jgi:hypothetical protein
MTSDYFKKLTITFVEISKILAEIYLKSIRAIRIISFLKYSPIKIYFSFVLAT